jgi:hypothetical protein
LHNMFVGRHSSSLGATCADSFEQFPKMTVKFELGLRERERERERERRENERKRSQLALATGISLKTTDLNILLDVLMAKEFHATNIRRIIFSHPFHMGNIMVGLDLINSNDINCYYFVFG